ncbi:MAG: M50 family metallopeptidase [Acidobacteriota bacterium]|nr:M50 family metallopeptidase [Acidobacteriota bacterium]
MNSLRKQNLHLIRLAGIDVSLHWSWFLVAAFEISSRTGTYSSPIWNVLEYLALFLIVTMHEFGHALACRQTGGTANRIVLWPLGGVAYVSPPPRPGATLWSIAAGPLVNVALIPVLYLLSGMSHTLGWAQTMPDVYTLLHAVVLINWGLLIFNVLPIYPLDGGQILRSLLWFLMGRAASLTAATMIGMVGVVGLIAVAVWVKSVWFGVLAIFILMNCGEGFGRRERCRVWPNCPGETDSPVPRASPLRFSELFGSARNAKLDTTLSSRRPPVPSAARRRR